MTDPKTQGYAESEQKTPIAGYILLLAMFAASTFFGWRALDDLQNVPKRPELLSQCAAEFAAYTWEDWGREYQGNFREAYAPPPFEPAAPYRGGKPAPVGETPKCKFSAIEKEHGIPAIFEKYGAPQLTQDLQQTEIDLSDYQNRYQIALTERIAEAERKLYDIPEIQRKLEELRKKKVELEIRRDAFRGEIKPVYRALMDEYRGQWRWYEFKVFLLEIIFVVPFFLLVLWGYRKLLARNSPYTIIATALVAVASVLMLRVLISWFWSLFLARVLENLWNIVKNIALLKSIVFYGGMVLSILIFGGAVYLLQKRIFDPKRVAMRRLRQKLCPSCQTSLDLADEFCPDCGRKLKEKCSSCVEDRWVDFPKCPNCGYGNKEL